MKLLILNTEPLQRLRRWDEAVKHYQCLPFRLAYRHYNLASVWWQRGQPEQALVHLLRGYTRDRGPAQALASSVEGGRKFSDSSYWARFGDLWDTPGRRFWVGICRQLVVRWQTRVMLERKMQKRQLLSAHCRKWLVWRGLAYSVTDPAEGLPR